MSARYFTSNSVSQTKSSVPAGTQHPLRFPCWWAHSRNASLPATEPTARASAPALTAVSPQRPLFFKLLSPRDVQRRVTRNVSQLQTRAAARASTSVSRTTHSFSAGTRQSSTLLSAGEHAPATTLLIQRLSPRHVPRHVPELQSLATTPTVPASTQHFLRW